MEPNILYRLEQLERRYDRLDKRTEDINVIKFEQSELKNDVGDLSRDVKDLRKALITAGLGFLTGAALLAFSIVQVFGGP